MPPSAHSARADLERLRGASGTAGDASPFRTAMRNIIAACRNSPLALASYCQQGVLPALAAVPCVLLICVFSSTTPNSNRWIGAPEQQLLQALQSSQRSQN